MTITEGEIFDKVREVLVSSLGVDEAEVTPEARLEEDLGAESIDYLDIAFQMERKFDITIPPNEMLMGDMMAEPYLVEGRITDAGMAELRTRFPQLNLDPVEQSRDVRDVRRSFTVETLARFMQTKLGVAAATPG